MTIFVINLLTAIFIGLKISNAVSWSWWWVLSPTIFSVTLVVYVILVMATKIICIMVEEKNRELEIEKLQDNLESMLKLFDKLKGDN